MGGVGLYFVPKGSCLTKRGIEMSEKNGVEGECEDDELRKEAEGAVGAIELPDIGSATNEELEEFVTKVLRCVASLKSVKIDRAHFLRSELKRRCPEINAELAIEKTPIEAGISPQELDRIAAEVIDFETKKCSALSFLAGLPGGVAIAGSITADAAQYFAHVMRIEQKLAYLYGWQSFLDKENEVDDETVGLLIAFLGVVLNVTGVAGTITKITAGVAVDGVAAAIKKQTLTKLPWWKPAKQVIKVLTQKTMTKEVFANAVAKKAVPVAGAFISGGFTSHAQTAFKRSACNLGAFFEDIPSRLGSLSNNAANSCHAVSQSFTSLLARRNCRSPCRTNRLRSVFDRLINNIFCCPVDLRLVNSRNREGPEVLAQALGAWLE